MPVDRSQPNANGGKPRDDLTGRRFGDLTVMSFSYMGGVGRRRCAWWDCSCSCGAPVTTTLPWIRQRVNSARPVSCGHEEWLWPGCTIDSRMKAYLAGLIDSEGTVGLLKTGRTKHSLGAFLVIGMTGDLPAELHRRVGLGVVNVRRPQCQRWRPTTIWSLNQGDIKKLLPAVMDYLVIKRVQAELVVEFLRSNSGPGKTYKRWNAGVLVENERTKDRLALLNSRGVLHKHDGRTPQHGDEAWPYFAGLVDGDGSFSLSQSSGGRKKPHYHMTLSVSMCHDGLLAVREMLGGVGKARLRGPRSVNKAPAWEWRIAGLQLLDILPKLTPHLILKQRQAALADEFFAAYGRHNFGAGHDAAEAIRLQMADLNARGVPTST